MLWWGSDVGVEQSSSGVSGTLPVPRYCSCRHVCVSSTSPKKYKEELQKDVFLSLKAAQVAEYSSYFRSCVVYGGQQQPGHCLSRLSAGGRRDAACCRGHVSAFNLVAH